MPERYGKWQSVYDRFNFWRKPTARSSKHFGARLHLRLNEEGRLDFANSGASTPPASAPAAQRPGAAREKKTGLTTPVNKPWAARGAASAAKVHLVVDGHGIPLAATITAGQTHESKQAGRDAGARCVCPTARVAHSAAPETAGRATKGTVIRRVRAYLRRRGILPVIPRAKNQRTNPRFDKATYKKRNVIERCVGWLKENRQLATRHAKLAVNYLATVKLAMIRRCLHLLHDPSDRT